MTTPGKILSLITYALVFIAGIWLARSCSCVGGRKSEVVGVKIDTVYKNYRDTIHVPFETLVPYKVEYKTTKLLHDSFYADPVLMNVDTSVILEQYFAKRYYAQTYTIQYGEAHVVDTVSQNRIIGRQVIIDQNIPEITKTVTVAEKKKLVLFWGIQGLFNKDNLPYASGVTLDLKLKNDGMIGGGIYITRDKPMLSASLKFPIGRRKK